MLRSQTNKFDLDKHIKSKSYKARIKILVQTRTNK